jgi:predicted PurR-regulated permease PerM
MHSEDYKLKLIEEYDKTLKQVENNICKETNEIVNEYRELKNKYNKLLVYLFVIFVFLPILILILYKFYEGYMDKLLIHRLIKQLNKKNKNIKDYQKEIRHYQSLLQHKWDMDKNLTKYFPEKININEYEKITTKFYIQSKNILSILSSARFICIYTFIFGLVIISSNVNKTSNLKKISKNVS